MTAPDRTTLDAETLRMIEALHPDHRAQVTELAEFASNLGNELDRDHLKRSHEGHLYHYTNDVGLFAILQSGVMWLSDYTSLNDPKEVAYGIDVGYRLLEEVCNTDGGRIAIRLAEYFAELVEGSRRIAKFFILSMSLADDELGQWRSYGNNGSGYSLAFDAKTLVETFDRDFATLGQAFRVLYQEDLLRSLMARLCEKVSATIANLPTVSDDLDDAAIVAIANDLFLTMVFIALHFKHPAYRAEQEFRLLIVSPQIGPPRMEMKKRVRNHQIIDFLEFKWPKPSLAEIVAGPATRVDVAEQFVSSVLALHMPGSSINICRSVIPYRP